MNADNRFEICHLTINSLANASRIYKELSTAEALFAPASLLCIGLNKSGEKQGLLLGRYPFEEISLKTANLPKQLPFQLIKYIEWTVRAASRARKSGAKILHCHSLPALPASVLARLFLPKSRILYDAHELETKRANMSRARQLASSFLERALMPFIDEILVVSPSIEVSYQKSYPNKPITLLLNLPRAAGTSSSIDLRARLSIPADAKIVIYVGALGPMRGIEPLLEAVEGLDGWHCVFLGEGPLAEQINDAAQKCPNIHHHAYVDESEIIGIVAQADLSFSVTDCTADSYRLALPNKFFQSLMAGVPIMVNTEQVDMLAFREKTQMVFGVEFNVAAIRDFIETFSARNVARKPQSYSWEAQQEKLVAIYKRLSISA